MEYQRLGKSGLQVSRLSFGSWLTFGKQVGDTTAEDLMKTAYDGGVNFFDNAEAYAGGKSEEVMGEVLKKMGWQRDSYIVSSKVFFGADGGSGSLMPTQKGLNRKHVVEACDQALKRLQMDYLDLYFCHRPDKNTPIEETVWTMHNLIQQGKILYWGTSEWSAQEIMEAHRIAERYNLIGPTMEQPQYNMLVREKVEVEYDQIYKTVGLGTTIWSPLASGVLTGKYNDGFPEDTRLGIEGMEWLKDRTLAEQNLSRVRKVSEFARELEVSMPLLAIAWCLKNDNVSTVILGASKTSQLEENLKAFDILDKLTDESMTKIDEILENKPVFPPF
ncbi:aldo/keto reductase [Fulvivirga sp. M361]|uniref:potassium channel beta subunit family protein n=1 Tax=Fulvivirga sp. M361 TaxID=2594266 RepID=UPI00117A848E|nr:aldo/keto reductase [Fulvivirga sp. M361]TRX62172.1 aldo/keto reductase [Fulvivirga sp. M361]